ncbi:autotransporter domain-containing protein [Parapusillimonas granuli]|uniref:autotransporter domain-containing protein n=1 Tax=Parapusillimonas granuli TaxID=380911 RepID=UPI001C84913C|nr:autotransporter domain-containing protein [Parapusillimonas granuli]
MIKKYLLLSSAAFVFSGAAPAQVAAPNYTSIWSFGDSLSDTGRTYFSSGVTIAYQAPKGPLYYNGRFSSGPVWVENLHKLNSTALQYDQSHNLAYGGAVIGDLVSLKMKPFINNVQEQTEFFSKILDRQISCMGWALSCTVKRSFWEKFISNFDYAGRITASETGSKPLVTFAIGGNNFRQELEDRWAWDITTGGLIPSVGTKHVPGDPNIAKRDILSKVPTELRKINNALATRGDIARDGVTYYVATIPNIAQTPKVNVMVQSLQDQYGKVIQETNRELKKSLFELGDEFAAKNAKTRLVVIDFDALLAEAIKSPTAFGFTETKKNCVAAETGKYVNGCSGSNSNQFLFWDEFHPTAKGHEMIARYARNTDLLEFGSNVNFIEPYVANIEWRNRSFTGNISGSGSLIKQGEARLTLAGNNSYAGGTRIDNGTVRITSDANLGARSGMLTLQGGALQASGTTTLNRDVKVNASQSIGQIGGSVFGGTFEVDPNVVLTLADNTLSGTGDIRKTGQGELDIRSRDEGKRKLTQVDLGTLAVNTSTPYQSERIVVERNAFLQGSGTIVGKTEIRGQAQPGNSIGTLNVVGDLVIQEGGSYQFEVATRSADYLHVTGNIIMDGDVVVDVETNEKVSDQRYPLFGYTGTLTGLDYDSLEVSPFLRANLEQGNQRVDIAFARDFTWPADTAGQRAMAAHLNAAFRQEDQGDLNNVFDALDDTGTAPAARRALDVLSGQSIGNALTAGAIQQGQFTRALEDRLAARRGGRDAQGVATPLSTRSGSSGLGGALQTVASSVSNGNAAGGSRPGTASVDEVSVWARAMGGPSKVRGAGAFSMTNFGVLAGLDKTFGDHLVGASFGYGNFSVDGNQGGDTDADVYQIALYGSARKNSFFLDGTAAYSHADYKTKRALEFGGMSRVARGKSRGDNFGLSLKSGLHLQYSGLAVEPSLGFDWYHLKRGGFSETGADAAGLDVKSQKLDLVMPSIGVRVSSTHEFGSRTLTPELSARYYYNAGDTKSDTRAALIGAPAGTPGFVATSTGLGRNIGVVSAGLSVQNDEKLRFFARYELAVDNHTTANAFSVGLQYRW